MVSSNCEARRQQSSDSFSITLTVICRNTCLHTHVYLLICKSLLAPSHVTRNPHSGSDTSFIFNLIEIFFRGTYILHMWHVRCSASSYPRQWSGSPFCRRHAPAMFVTKWSCLHEFAQSNFGSPKSATRPSSNPIDGGEELRESSFYSAQYFKLFLCAQGSSPWWGLYGRCHRLVHLIYSDETSKRAEFAQTLAGGVTATSTASDAVIASVAIGTNSHKASVWNPRTYWFRWCPTKWDRVYLLSVIYRLLWITYVTRSEEAAVAAADIRRRCPHTFFSREAVNSETRSS